MDQETIHTYNKLAKEYDNETVDFWDRFPKRIIDRFVDSVSGSVLDIGSGPGRDASILCQYGLEVVCLDASDSMLEITRQKGLKSVKGDFLSIPLPDESFQGIWAYTSLIHTQKSQLPLALNEIKRVLKKNGVFGLGIIEGDTEGISFSSGINLPRYFAYYKKAEIELVLENTGFEIFYFDEFQPKSRKYLNFLSRKV